MMLVTRHPTAESFLDVARSLLMIAEAENNLIIGIAEGLAEAVAFAKRNDLDVEKVISVISKGAAQSWQMENRWKTMNEGHFTHGFAVNWMRKDLAISLDEARRNHAHLPVAALVDQFYAEVQKMGGTRWDTSALLARLDR